MKKYSILINEKLPIALHVLAWIIIMLIPRYLIYNFGDGNKRFLYHLYINLAIYGSLFYLNYLWLVPKLFLRNRKLKYILSALVMIFIVCITMWYVREHLFFDRERAMKIQEAMKEINIDKELIKPPIKQFTIVNYISTSVLILGFSLGLKLLEKLTQNEKERKELEKEKLNSELAFLKNQISPHFFFNTLNNIYSLIGINTGSAQDSVLKLSKLMRYLLYESEKGETRLSDEIAFLSHYIDLMKLRLSDKVDLSVSLPSNYPNLSIPPLLFISFVENAFKHGISYREPSYIYIEMHVEKKHIMFITKNSVSTNSQKKNEQLSGIGLKNIQKRLNLLFPDSHRLVINKNADEFSVELFLETELKNEEN